MTQAGIEKNSLPKNNSLPKQYISLLFWVPILLLTTFYFANYLLTTPVGTHAWAQADRLALALNFYDNLSSFFLPRTYNESSIGRVVGVEFPLQSYLAALLSQPFGKAAVAPVFRLLDICISIAGLFSLYLIGRRYLKSVWLPILPPLFIWTTPIFVYYSATFIPDTAAVGFIFIATYFLCCFWDHGKIKNAWYCLFFISLAFYTKMSTGVFWVLTIGILGLGFIKYKKLISRPFLLFLIATILVGIGAIAYYLHIQYLNKEYQSWIFLAAPKPMSGSFEKQWTHACDVWFRWEYHIMTRCHQWWILAAFFLSVYAIFRKSIRWHFWQLIGLAWLVAALAIYLLMAEQFYVHDYYINTVLIPIMAWLSLSLCMGIDKLNTKAISILFSLSILGSLPFLYPKLQQRFENKGKEWYMHADFSDLPIPKDATVLVESPLHNPMAPNIPLIYFNRPGVLFSLPRFTMHSPKIIADWMYYYNLDYFICSPAYSDYLLKTLPETDSIFPLYYKSKDYVVHKPTPKLLHLDWSEDAPFNWKSDFEDCPDCDTLHTHSGHYGQHLLAPNKWSKSFSVLVDEKTLNAGLDSASFSLYFYADNWPENDSLSVYFQFKEPKMRMTYLSGKCYGQADSSGWRFAKTSVALPTLINKQLIGIFLENHTDKPIYIDDLQIEFN